ncbi:hypothetical protein Bhyg_15659 [Pseudolycoriella hygida]|uniref:Uncharacterized protein n=1 Tax=Pseudolycoriella hygida TaxID=35572 RepID=A0A9Q0ML15_9DIPT|nr:hypothetical protein Bhyg_15659 [Pseudolycoriella hygida]
MVADPQLLFKLIAFASIAGAIENLKPMFLVQNGSAIENLQSYPIGISPVTFLVNYSDPNYDTIVANVSESHIPVVIGASHSDIPFDLQTYYSALKTKQFGRNIIVGDYIPSTMDIGHDFGNIQGLVFIANKQRNGRGSNTTVWDSPRGDVYLNINLYWTEEVKRDLLPIHCDRALISAVKSTQPGDNSKLLIKLLKPISFNNGMKNCVRNEVKKFDLRTTGQMKKIRSEILLNCGVGKAGDKHKKNKNHIMRF